MAGLSVRASRPRSRESACAVESLGEKEWAAGEVFANQVERSAGEGEWRIGLRLRCAVGGTRIRGQVICRGRGRLARNEREARKGVEKYFRRLCQGYVCGRDARGPSKSLERLSRCWRKNGPQAKFSPTRLSGQPVKVNGVLVYAFAAQ